MKYMKMFGLLAVAAAALMAFAGSASAITLTDGAGTSLGVGAKIAATSTHTQLHGTVTLTCTTSHVEGEITKAGGTGKEVEGAITKLHWTNCGDDTVETVTPGKLTIGDDTKVKSTGTVVTALTHRIVFFIPVTTHCIYETNKTPIGSLTTSSETGSTAKLDIGTSPIPEVDTDSGCKDDAVWTGSYTVNTPHTLNHH